MAIISPIAVRTFAQTHAWTSHPSRSQLHNIVLAALAARRLYTSLSNPGHFWSGDRSLQPGYPVITQTRKTHTHTNEGLGRRWIYTHSATCRSTHNRSLPQRRLIKDATLTLCTIGLPIKHQPSPRCALAMYTDYRRPVIHNMALAHQAFILALKQPNKLTSITTSLSLSKLSPALEHYRLVGKVYLIQRLPPHVVIKAGWRASSTTFVVTRLHSQTRLFLRPSIPRWT